jgi:hypothetical protein
VNNRRTVPDHFIACIFDIATRASVAGGVPNQFNFCVPIDAERPFPFPQRSKAVASRAGAIPVTNNNSDPGFIFHFCFSFQDRSFLKDGG